MSYCPRFCALGIEAGKNEQRVAGRQHIFEIMPPNFQTPIREFTITPNGPDSEIELAH